MLKIKIKFITVSTVVVRRAEIFNWNYCAFYLLLKMFWHLGELCQEVLITFTQTPPIFCLTRLTVILQWPRYVGGC